MRKPGNQGSLLALPFPNLDLPVDRRSIPSGGKIQPENLWDAITHQIKLGVFWKDRQRNFLGANQHFLDYYGLTLPAILTGSPITAT
ncbi:hypothetical protein PF586_08130 [Lactobacillus delbrueckii]|uniref:PAS domain-containing protein n=1 Tax=Lactobacillus delbrueckii TaxID=1584 RepID=A0AAW5YWG0_9LACO|nr:hypothetical protein [Lactobacillus delbrueckii]MDA3768408.1 hypothetical protein [Lactobacillus delbrueckii]